MLYFFFSFFFPSFDFRSEPYQAKYGMAAANQNLLLDGPLISTIYPKPCFDMNPWHVSTTPASTYVRRSETKPKYNGAEWIPPSYPKMVRAFSITILL